MKRRRRKPRPRPNLCTETSRGGTQKIRYTRDQAEAEVRFHEAMFRRRMRCYECPVCGDWHLAKRRLR